MHARNTIVRAIDLGRALSSSCRQVSCISYSCSRVNGSDAVNCCSSGSDIHPWYLYQESTKLTTMNLMLWRTSMSKTTCSYFSTWVASYGINITCLPTILISAFSRIAAHLLCFTHNLFSSTLICSKYVIAAAIFYLGSVTICVNWAQRVESNG